MSALPSCTPPKGTISNHVSAFALGSPYSHSSPIRRRKNDVFKQAIGLLQEQRSYAPSERRELFIDHERSPACFPVGQVFIAPQKNKLVQLANFRLEATHHLTEVLFLRFASEQLILLEILRYATGFQRVLAFFEYHNISSGSWCFDCTFAANARVTSANEDGSARAATYRSGRTTAML